VAPFHLLDVLLALEELWLDAARLQSLEYAPVVLDVYCPNAISGFVGSPFVTVRNAARRVRITSSPGRPPQWRGIAG
jgi:hypothetical protein